ncbi:Gfo/Idh/MocA family protein [Vibrio sp. HN007]|uniref:Gfo/Idh/MocA family protein n=1 Tax=Vibrio iocasae TaxID=3098914 RepID=UPI0035D3E9F1
MTAKVKWGIIAPGRIAHRFAAAFSDMGDGELYAVASRNKTRANEFAAHHNIPVVFDSYNELIDSDKIDAIYIASPHRYHFETAKQCLEAGKAVLCEKPLTVTANQSEMLFSIARDNNAFLMEALWSRFLPCWKQVKHWVDEGEIGEIQLLRSTFGFQPENNKTNERLFSLDLAGGSLLDTGIYNIALTQFLMQKRPDHIHSSVAVGKSGVDERCSVLLDYGDVTSQFTCSFLSKLDNEFHITGSKGTIVVDGNFWESTSAKLIPVDGEVQIYHQPYRASGFEYQIDEVHQCLIEGKAFSDNMSPQATIDNMKVMDEILDKAGVKYPFADR